MLGNYLKIALRNLLRHKVHAAINVVGLAIALAFCALTFLFIRHEWSYDGFHENADRIYRAYTRETSPEKVRLRVQTPAPLGPTLVETYPEVTRTVRFRSSIPVAVRYGDKLFKEEGLLFADPEVFEVFSFPRVAGDLRSALDGKNKVVLTREMAVKYFGRTDPVDERLAIRGGREFDGEFTVTGVVDVPVKSSIRFDFLISFQYMLERDSGTRWNQQGTRTYVMLDKGAKAGDLEDRFPSFVDGRFTEILQASRETYGEFDMQLKLQPLRDIHLSADISPGWRYVSDPAYSYILGGISLAVLLIACANFTNLSLGLAATRFREVGMRKVLGSTRPQLVRQFCGEAVLLSLVALVMGLALAEISLPIFAGLVDRELIVEFDPAGFLLIGLVGVVGLGAGAYPALVLSRPQPTEVLRGRQQLGGANGFSRGLIVVQFALSAGLVVAALLMAEQMEFLVTRSLGFDRDQVVVVRTGGIGVSREEQERLLAAYRNVGAQRGDVLQVAAADASLDGWTSFSETPYEGRPFAFFSMSVEPRLLEILAMELMMGRNFIEGSSAEQQESVIVNETLVRSLGWDDPLGRRLPITRGTVVGVVRDFHLQSLHNAIKPVVLRYGADNALLNIFVEIKPDGIPATLDLLRQTWRQVLPDRPFAYSFLDEDVERWYQTEERWGRIVRYAAMFAVLIACLGTLGLTSLTVARRTKEIGIRKVLGASAGNIVALLSREFACLAIAANLIAWPVAYWAMQRWLEDFAYRIDLGPGMFALGGVLTLAVVLATVSAQAIRAALSDPVEALRYE